MRILHSLLLGVEVEMEARCARKARKLCTRRRTRHKKRRDRAQKATSVDDMCLDSSVQPNLIHRESKDYDSQMDSSHTVEPVV